MKIIFPEVLKVSFSRIKLWRRCQMAHHYRYYQGLRKIKRSKPLWMGTAIHECIEEYHEGRNWRGPLEKFRSEYNQLFNEEKAELGDLPRDLEIIMEGYFEYHSQDGLSYPVRRRGVCTELPVIVDLDHETQFVSYLDAYPQDEEGRNWLMDHKSCSKMPDEATRFSDLQLVTYGWLLPQLGYPRPDGVIWDYIRTKAPTIPEVLKSGELSKSSKIDTTYEVYMATVDRVLGKKARPQYEEFASSLKGKEDSFYRRVKLPSPPKILEENLVKDLLFSIAEIRSLGPKATVRNLTKDCSWCSYYNLCQAEVRGLDVEFIRKLEYTVKGEEDEKVSQEGRCIPLEK